MYYSTITLHPCVHIYIVYIYIVHIYIVQYIHCTYIHCTIYDILISSSRRSSGFSFTSSSSCPSAPVTTGADPPLESGPSSNCLNEVVPVGVSGLASRSSNKSFFLDLPPTVNLSACLPLL